eukprot:6603228-Pyramimonas_sp.AAC.1
MSAPSGLGRDPGLRSPPPLGDCQRPFLKSPPGGEEPRAVRPEVAGRSPVEPAPGARLQAASQRG